MGASDAAAREASNLLRDWLVGRRTRRERALRAALELESFTRSAIPKLADAHARWNWDGKQVVADKWSELLNDVTACATQDRDDDVRRLARELRDRHHDVVSMMMGPFDAMPPKVEKRGPLPVLAELIARLEDLLSRGFRRRRWDKSSS